MANERGRDEWATPQSKRRLKQQPRRTEEAGGWGSLTDTANCSRMQKPNGTSCAKVPIRLICGEGATVITVNTIYFRPVLPCSEW